MPGACVPHTGSNSQVEHSLPQSFSGNFAVAFLDLNTNGGSAQAPCSKQGTTRSSKWVEYNTFKGTGQPLKHFDGYW